MAGCMLRVVRLGLVAAVLGTGMVACSSDPSVPPARTWGTKKQLELGSVDQMGPKFRTQHFGPGTDARMAMRASSLDLLEQALRSESALLRANAVEAMQYEPPAVLTPVVRDGLRDTNRGVRFVAAMVAGRKRLDGALPELRSARLDSSASVRAAALFALHELGEPVDLSPLGPMMLSSDPEVKGNAALVLGEIGDPSAVPLLRRGGAVPLERVEPTRQRIVNLQISEALVRTGEEAEIQTIRAALFSPEEKRELSILACQICGRLDDRAAVNDLLNIASATQTRGQPAELQMAATAAVGEIAPGRAPVEVPLRYTTSAWPELRAQSAATLGAIADPESFEALGRLVLDPNPVVQVAAAGSILRLTADGSG